MPATETAQFAPGVIVPLKLADLIPCKDNSRKAKEKLPDPVLVASIRSRGLLQNLGVRTSETAPGKFEVKYGSRRFAALKALLKEGHFKKNDVFPCRITSEAAADAAEEQLAENISRKELNPIDAFEAFARLKTQGLDEEAIAIRFGVDVRTIKQRLALGQAAPLAHKALRAEEITLEVARLFAGCPDVGKQERVFKQIVRTGHFSPHVVKRLLHEGALAANDDLVRFVTLDAYRAAGGPIETDLFEDTVRILDADLARRLCDDRLAAEVERLLSGGWSWAEAHESHPWQAGNGMDRVYGQCVESTANERAEIETLETEIDTFENADHDALSDEDWDRLDRLQDRLSDLRQVRRVFSAEQKAVSGCIVSLKGAEIRIDYGLVRKEDCKRAAALKRSGVEVGAEGLKDDRESAVSHTPDADAGYGIGLRSDLAVFRAQALAAAIASEPSTAILAAQFILVWNVFRPSHARAASGTTQTASRVLRRVGQGDLEATQAAALLRRAENAARLDIFESGSFAGGWILFKSLSEAERGALIAYGFATSIDALSTSPTFIDRLAFEMALDIRRYWTPTADNFSAV